MILKISKVSHFKYKKYVHSFIRSSDNFKMNLGGYGSQGEASRKETANPDGSASVQLPFNRDC
jgi:hypothetical protein